MQGAGHFYKVLDEHSIIIAEDTPQNRREYEDLVIKTFFLSNADVKEIDKLLRSLIEARRLSTNEQLNAITLRDTADKVAIAEKLIRVNDKAKAEVLIDVEILIMASTKNSNIGTALSTYNFNLGLDTGAINPLAPDGITGPRRLHEHHQERLVHQRAQHPHQPRQERRARPRCWRSRSSASPRAKRRIS